METDKIWYSKAPIEFGIDKIFAKENYLFFGNDKKIVNTYYEVYDSIINWAEIKPVNPLIIDAHGHEYCDLEVRKIDMKPETYYELLFRDESHSQYEISIGNIVKDILKNKLNKKYDSLIVTNILEHTSYKKIDNHCMNDLVVFDKKILKILNKEVILKI